MMEDAGIILGELADVLFWWNWDKKNMSRGEKIFTAAAFTAIVGGIGFMIYKAFDDKKKQNWQQKVAPSDLPLEQGTAR